jgi:hypothetical protein
LPAQFSTLNAPVNAAETANAEPRSVRRDSESSNQMLTRLRSLLCSAQLAMRFFAVLLLTAWDKHQSVRGRTWLAASRRNWF